MNTYSKNRFDPTDHKIMFRRIHTIKEEAEPVFVGGNFSDLITPEFTQYYKKKTPGANFLKILAICDSPTTKICSSQLSVLKTQLQKKKNTRVENMSECLKKK